MLNASGLRPGSALSCRRYWVEPTEGAVLAPVSLRAPFAGTEPFPCSVLQPYLEVTISETVDLI